MGAYISSLGQWEPYPKSKRCKCPQSPRRSQSLRRSQNIETLLMKSPETYRPLGSRSLRLLRRDRSYTPFMFGDQCMGYDGPEGRVPPPFMYGRRKGRNIRKGRSIRKRHANPMARKAMKYYQRHKHQGVTLKDAWDAVRGNRFGLSDDLVFGTDISGGYEQEFGTGTGHKNPPPQDDFSEEWDEKQQEWANDPNDPHFNPAGEDKEDPSNKYYKGGHNKFDFGFEFSSRPNLTM